MAYKDLAAERLTLLAKAAELSKEWDHLDDANLLVPRNAVSKELEAVNQRLYDLQNELPIAKELELNGLKQQLIQIREQQSAAQKELEKLAYTEGEIAQRITKLEQDAETTTQA